MRYRLLPVFYAAARENYETGEPLLRRLDLEFPQYANRSSLLPRRQIRSTNLVIKPDSVGRSVLAWMAVLSR